MHSPAVVNERSLPGIVGVLLGAIRDQLHIAEKVCYALAQLAAGFKDDAQNASLLSPYFKDIVAALLEAVRARSLLQLSPCPAERLAAVALLQGHRRRAARGGARAFPSTLCSRGTAACLASQLADGDAIAVVGAADSACRLRGLHAACSSVASMNL